jgi:hypothetical protein
MAAWSGSVVGASTSASGTDNDRVEVISDGDSGCTDAELPDVAGSLDDVGSLDMVHTFLAEPSTAARQSCG